MNLGEGLRRAHGDNVRPEDQATYYLGAAEALCFAISKLDGVADEETLNILGNMGNTMCDLSEEANKQFMALPWWKKIVKRV